MSEKLLQGINSPYMKGKRIQPVHCDPSVNYVRLMQLYGDTCFEARKTARAARTIEEMINKDFTVWLGVAGAGPVGGLGGYIIDLIKAGHIDAICSTGAQVYHDAHFAFDLPVVQGYPKVDDNELRRQGVVRIYDLFVGLKETLLVQDDIFREFSKTLEDRELSTADFCYEWGKYILAKAPYPEKSWAAAAARHGVPLFLDSESNHSIGMAILGYFLEFTKGVKLSPNLSLSEATAIVYHSKNTGFIELGGGGPKNWIQTLSPELTQILHIEFEGADMGIQITTAPEHDGGLSGASFAEAVSWEKYKDANSPGLVQICAEYSLVFPLLAGYAIQKCKPHQHKRLMDHKAEFYSKLVEEAEKQRK